MSYSSMPLLARIHKENKGVNNLQRDALNFFKMQIVTPRIAAITTSFIADI
jgi:hypothetical protein